MHAFITEDILKHHIKDCFKINGKQTIKVPKNGRYTKCKNVEKKNKITIYDFSDFERILVPEDNVKQNLNKSYANKY